MRRALAPNTQTRMENAEQKDRKRSQRRGSRGPTVADVARLAGVSPMTVSRVVNREQKVQSNTREKVEAAISQLGYVPNLAARSLAGGRQYRIALLHSNPSASYLSEFLVGSLAEASALDAQLVLEYCADSESTAALVQKVTKHRVDAVLLPPPLSDDDALVSALHSAGFPIAQVATGAPASFAVSVSIDDEAAAHALTSRLIDLGHRRIGLITGDSNQTVSALRRSGYRRALQEAGLTAEACLEVPGDFTYRSGFSATQKLLQLSPRPSAIFACNDDMAAAAIATAHRLGIDVPRELAVCGFDDTASATMIWPELTTARQPVADMARLATRLLVSILTGTLEAHLQHQQLDYTLVVRDSDARSPVKA